MTLNTCVYLISSQTRFSRERSSLQKNIILRSPLIFSRRLTSCVIILLCYIQNQLNSSILDKYLNSIFSKTKLFIEKYYSTSFSLVFCTQINFLRIILLCYIWLNSNILDIFSNRPFSKILNEKYFIPSFRHIFIEKYYSTILHQKGQKNKALNISVINEY